MCTLRNFPHLIDHCIEWARAQFEDLFSDPAQKAAKVLDDVDAFLKKVRSETFDAEQARTSKIAKAIGSVRNLISTLDVAVGGASMDNCVRMAWSAFHALFRDKITDLTDKFPADATDSKGEPFWAAHKRFPQAAKYDPSNVDHVAFMISASNLFAAMLKIHGPKPPSELNDPSQRWQAQYREPTWLAFSIAKLGGTPAVAKGQVDMEGVDEGKENSKLDGRAAELELESLLTRVASIGAHVAKSGVKGFEPADFEKDDDDNFHIDFITACSNLRAANYHIPAASRHKCKMVAGRIIPAIATTTASVTGLVMLEMIKVLQHKPVEQLRNGNYDLGSNQFMLFEAEPPKSIADHIKIDKPDPKQFPDAYDENGELTDMYKDPDMCLGFAERIKSCPNPHTKYDKVWVGPLPPDATVADLRDAINAIYANGGIKVSMISAPTQRIECDKNEDNPSGHKPGVRMLWNSAMPGTNAQLTEPWVPLLKKLTTRTDTWPTIDDPVDVSKRVLFSDLAISLFDAVGDEITTPPIVIKLQSFDFVSYTDRSAREVVPWLEAEAAKRPRRGSGGLSAALLGCIPARAPSIN